MRRCSAPSAGAGTLKGPHAVTENYRHPADQLHAYAAAEVGLRGGLSRWSGPESVCSTWLTIYLVIIGTGLLLAPRRALEMLQSSADYGDVFPRLSGMLM